MVAFTLENKTRGLVLGVIALLLFLGLGVIAQRDGKTPSQARPTLAKLQNNVRLSLQAQQDNLEVGGTTTVKVILETEDQRVDAADVVLTYDPRKLTVERVEKGTVFDTYPAAKSKGERVTLSGFASFDNESPTVKTSHKDGTVGKVVFRAKKAGRTRIDFIGIGSETIAAWEGKNVLSSTQGLSLIIN